PTGMRQVLEVLPESGPDAAVNVAAGEGEAGTQPQTAREPLFARGVQGAVREAVEFGDALGRLGRGESLVEREGRYFVVDEAGNTVREVEPPQDFIPSAAPILRGINPLSPEAVEERRRRY